MEHGKNHGGSKGLYKIFNNLAAEFKEAQGSDLCRDLTAPYEFESRDRAVKSKEIIGHAAALAAKHMLMENDGSLDFVETIREKNDPSGLFF